MTIEREFSSHAEATEWRGLCSAKGMYTSLAFYRRGKGPVVYAVTAIKF